MLRNRSHRGRAGSIKPYHQINHEACVYYHHFRFSQYRIKRARGHTGRYPYPPVAYASAIMLILLILLVLILVPRLIHTRKRW